MKLNNGINVRESSQLFIFDRHLKVRDFVYPSYYLGQHILNNIDTLGQAYIGMKFLHGIQIQMVSKTKKYPQIPKIVKTSLCIPKWQSRNEDTSTTLLTTPILGQSLSEDQ